MVEYDKLFLKKSIVENKDITSEGILVYTALVIMSENKVDRVYTTVSAIEFALKMDFSEEDRYFKDKIKKGLLNLVENKIINIVHKNNDFKPTDTLGIRLLDFYIDTKNSEYFITVNVKDILKIISYNEKKFEFEKLLRYYYVLVGTINSATKIGFTSIDTLSKRANISDKIIKSKYNSILENLQLIYIERSDVTIKYDDGTIKKVRNTYGLYRDKEKVIKEANDFNSDIEKSKYNNVIDGNKARSIKNKYNYIMNKINNGDEVEEEKIKEINKEIKLYNKRYEYNDEKAKLNYFPL